MTTAQIPSKMMLSGEYSVLQPGGVAVSVATSPGFLLTATASHEDTVSTPDEPTVEGPEPGAFVRAALEQIDGRLALHADPRRPRLAVTFRSAGTDCEVSGASAALCTGTVACSGRLCGLSLQPAQLVRLASLAHRAAQGGGSGYDIVTQVRGGMVLCRAPDGVPADGGRGLPTQTDVDVDVARSDRFSGVLVWAHTGRSSPTSAMLGGFRRCLDDPVFCAVLDQHAESSARLGHLLFHKGWCRELPEQIEETEQTLRALDRAGSLGLFTREIEVLLEQARRAGLPARISGAGGGDRVVGFAPDLAMGEVLVKTWCDAGYRAGLVVPADGLQVTPR